MRGARPGARDGGRGTGEVVARSETVTEGRGTRDGGRGTWEVVARSETVTEGRGTRDERCGAGDEVRFGCITLFSYKNE